MTTTMKKYTTKSRTFRMTSDGRLIEVHIDGRFDGFIFNTNKVIFVGGEKVVSSDFFK